MKALSSLSVYNIHTTDKYEEPHTLVDLVPDNREYGWHVARNLCKPLNQLYFLRQKEALAVKLGLHNVWTNLQLFDSNYELLTLHQSGRMTTREAIQRIAYNCRLTENEVT